MGKSPAVKRIESSRGHNGEPKVGERRSGNEKTDDSKGRIKRNEIGEVTAALDDLLVKIEKLPPQDQQEIKPGMQRRLARLCELGESKELDSHASDETSTSPIGEQDMKKKVATVYGQFGILVVEGAQLSFHREPHQDASLFDEVCRRLASEVSNGDPLLDGLGLPIEITSVGELTRNAIRQLGSAAAQRSGDGLVFIPNHTLSTNSP